MEQALALHSRMEELWKEQNPFVAFCLPQSQEVLLYFQKDKKLNAVENLNVEGFVFAPFDLETPIYSIPNTHQEQFPLPKQEVQLKADNTPAEIESKKNSFHHLVQKTMDIIHSGAFKKIVVSRKIEQQSIKSPVAVFMDLLATYKEAMVYLWRHPKAGCWLGASPEKFLRASEDGVQTQALAGTQVFNPLSKPKWKKKEIEEQALVVEQVRKDLTLFFSSEEILEYPPESVRAGNLMHLSSRFELPKFSKNLGYLARALHPTPAVGGIPKAEAIQFIKEHEGYDRSFYTGFFGPVNREEADLFVNLRCAAYTAGKFNIYVGAGITAESDPEKEWEETQRKAQTLLKVL